jgi:hypothetical protein
MYVVFHDLAHVLARGNARPVGLLAVLVMTVLKKKDESTAWQKFESAMCHDRLKRAATK